MVLTEARRWRGAVDRLCRSLGRELHRVGDDWRVTIQDALVALKLAGGEFADLMNEVVDQALIAQAVAATPPR
jgi:hypothetical protein